MIIVYHQMDPTQTDVMSTVITRRLLYFHFLLIILTKSTHLISLVSSSTYLQLWHGLMWVRLGQYISCINQLQQNLSSKLSFYLIQVLSLSCFCTYFCCGNSALKCDHFDLCLEPAELSRGCPSHQKPTQTLISHTAPWSHNISLELSDIPVLPHNPILPHLRRHLLVWRAEVESALHSRRALIALLA